MGSSGPATMWSTTGMEHKCRHAASKVSGLPRRAAFGGAMLPPGANWIPADINAALQHNTRLVVLSHASNVTGSVMPRPGDRRPRPEAGKTSLFCVDAAQTAGALPIDTEAMAIDLLAFTGHKSLYGPQGTGGTLCPERT